MNIQSPSTTDANHRTADVILIVDDVPENLAVLHDALDESGFEVLVANHGEAALKTALQVQPDIVLLDAIMPGMDGFEVCRRLKDNLNTRSIPVIFMTGLTEPEDIIKAFAAGGVDYVTKPVNPNVLLARLFAHIKNSRLMQQTRGALDMFGQATIAIHPADARVLWQTPLARQWLKKYFAGAEVGVLLNDELHQWLRITTTALKNQHAIQPFHATQSGNRLTLTLIQTEGEAEWLLALREESDIAQIDALISVFNLTRREAEVLYWVVKGKTNKDIGDILGTSPRTINKHMEHVFSKLGVETRTAAASLAIGKIQR